MCAVSRGRAQRRPNKPPKTVEAPWAWPKLLPRASNRASRFAWTVSRVLFRPRVAARSVKIIHLGAALPRRSSTLTRIPRLLLRVGLWPDRPQRYPYSSLLREGLASSPVTRLSRVGSYPTISPLPGEREALATSLGPEVDRCSSAVSFLLRFPSGHPGSVLPTSLSYGARTFLPRTMRVRRRSSVHLRPTPGS